jgi:peptidoglycan/LPS O-acetylase OafA/YrhL
VVLSTLRSGWHDLTHRPATQEPALDALRAAAVLLVICTHYALPEWPKAHGPEIALANWPIFYYGWTGVDLFFVLSGLLIGRALWRELAETGRIRVWRFWMRRGFRIWPLYYAVLAIWAFAGKETAWPNWVLLTNYFPRGYDRSWSLATEEQFYLIVPFLLWATIRSVPRRFAALPVVALTAAIPLVRYVARQNRLALGLSEHAIHESMGPPIHLHCEALLVGLLLAWLSVERPTWIAPSAPGRVSRHGLSVLVAGVALGSALDLANKDLFAFTALGLIFGAVTYFVLVDRSWLTRPLHAFTFYPISRLSYGMYLNHFYVAPESTAWAVRHVPGPPHVVFIGGLLLGTAISIGAATVTFLVVEHPFLKLRQAWLSRARTVPVPAGIAAD